MNDRQEPRRAIALIVEDDQDQRALAAALVEETDFTVVECDSGEAALKVAAMTGEALAMVLTDVNLAGRISGLELARQMRSRYPRASVVVTSGRPITQATSLPEGAVFIAKPWRALDLLRIAERAVARPEGCSRQLTVTVSAGCGTRAMFRPDEAFWSLPLLLWCC